MSIRKHYSLDSSTLKLTPDFVNELLTLDFLKTDTGKSGLFFSDYTLKHYLEKEYKYDIKIITDEQDSLLNKSTGERRMLLFKYLINQNPDFLIIDNPFDTLDTHHVKWLRSQLYKLSNHTTILQLYRRKEDVLQFITTELNIDSDYKINTIKSSEERAKKVIYELHDEFPQSLSNFNIIPESLVRFENVSVFYGEKPILRAINWEIKKGETWYLKGPNGSGKTTLINMMSGDNTKGYGQKLYLFDKQKGSGESVWDIKQKIGLFTTNLTEHFDGSSTVIEMILSGFFDSVGLIDKPSNLQSKIAEQWLSLLALLTQKNNQFSTLNESQKRMILIARAMIKQPPLLILDEPTSSLDDIGAQRVIALIKRIVNQSNTALIYVSHRPEKNLILDYTFELIANKSGSYGICLK
ncbi:ABC transporter ATP-binding protein [Leeuwenhoekiella aequorea]|uniref:Molybdate transport system ATP-binding protein n=1 Tax=Leeuwenhoekiella aequorea TaxID=283736 RepID=A0A4Q0PAR0_9FLAO|nr:ATP-binding cassette domain-containing protein [Leeuwenhoekiella aequorea]RXG23853.1 molybdate transport system ATP-binding protein [Leeuwenhoekiella aequorea]